MGGACALAPCVRLPGHTPVLPGTFSPTPSSALASTLPKLSNKTLPNPPQNPPSTHKTQKNSFNAIQQELTQLSTKFSNNVLDATKAYKKLLTTKEEVEGLPATALALPSHNRRGRGWSWSEQWCR